MASFILFILLLTTTATTTASPPAHQNTTAVARLPTLVPGTTLFEADNFTVNSAKLVVIKPDMSQNSQVSIHGLDHLLLKVPVSAAGVKTSCTWLQVAAAAVVVGLLLVLPIVCNLEHGSSAGSSQGHFRGRSGPLTFLVLLTTLCAMLSPVVCDTGDRSGPLQFNWTHDKSAFIVLAVISTVFSILFFILVVLAFRYYCLFKFRTVRPDIEMSSF